MSTAYIPPYVPPQNTLPPASTPQNALPPASTPQNTLPPASSPSRSAAQNCRDIVKVFNINNGKIKKNKAYYYSTYAEVYVDMRDMIVGYHGDDAGLLEKLESMPARQLPPHCS